MNEHEPLVKTYEPGVGVSCTCGWSDPYLWSFEQGAQTAFLQHVVTAHMPNHWRGTATVEYDPEARG